ncbi:MAG: 16S rRNA (cytidine(1402)-2'-O)-methyltransferase [Bacteroidia bacterium]
MRITLVPTPIGNLEDMTLRAIRVLREASLIAAEDTRTSGVLLKHYGIETPQTALHQHNEHRRVPELVQRVRDEDLHLAVITDAGTPGISDPGFLLVREALRQGVPVETLPGPVAFVPALVSSGLPCDRFVFEGFLPPKKGRQTRIRELAADPRTWILYESPHRLLKTLEQLIEACGPERPASASRELSKLHESHVHGSLAHLREHFTRQAPKGEFVLVVGGSEAALPVSDAMAEEEN